MPIKPRKGESQGDFMGRCMHELGQSDTKRPQDQKVAICMTAWRDVHGGNEKQYEDDWMDNCIADKMDEGMDQIEAENVCARRWENMNMGSDYYEDGAPRVKHKVHISPQGEGLEFVLSDASVDRFGDIINADGWDLTNFKKNPIALFNHSKDFVIGRWEGLKVVGNALRGHLVLAPEGTSPRIDEIRKLVQAGILRAVSVGFRALQAEPLNRASPNGGQRYIKSELVETSLVAVPANANALLVSRSLGVSKETLDFVFAKNGTVKRDRSSGKHAETSVNRERPRQMSGPLTKRIEDAQERIVTLRDQLSELVKSLDDENPDEAATLSVEELTDKIEAQEKSLEALKKAEMRLAAATSRSDENIDTTVRSGDSNIIVRNNRPFAIPAKKIAPQDYMWRGLAVAVKHHLEGKQRTILDVLKAEYGEDEPTRVVMANMITRGAVLPADTTTTGWAKELVQTVIGDFLNALQPIAVYPKLAAKGGTFTFGRNGIISLPSRSATPTIAGSFVAQGAPIPVRQGGFEAISLTPKKMGVITTLTREISEHSTPAIEAIIRQAILEDTAVAIDTVLLDANAATTTRPAGLKNGVGALGPTGAGGIAAVVGDLKLMVAALITATNGNLRSPVWIMSPADVLALSLTQAAAGGDFPFRDELSRGMLMGFPVIQSVTGTTDTMYLVDAADFVTATGDTPRFDVSDQAVLHEEDTTPTAISATAGSSPNTVAAPARSLWQTDTMAIRMLLDINWAMRRTGCVQWVTSLSWN